MEWFPGFPSAKDKNTMGSGMFPVINQSARTISVLLCQGFLLWPPSIVLPVLASWSSWGWSRMSFIRCLQRTVQQPGCTNVGILTLPKVNSKAFGCLHWPLLAPGRNCRQCCPYLLCRHHDQGPVLYKLEAGSRLRQQGKAQCLRATSQHDMMTQACARLICMTILPCLCS